MYSKKAITILSAILLMFTGMIYGRGSLVPVGEYLYADVAKLPEAPGALEIHFADESASRIAVAWRWQYRKMHGQRQKTTEEGRNAFKPRLARMAQNGKIARFEKLPPDFYDIVVIDPATMTVTEGISLLQFDPEQPEDTTDADREQFKDAIRKTLARNPGKLDGWEAFFDTKILDRFEFDDDKAAVFLQQIRTEYAFAESGEKLPGFVRCIDVVWLLKTKDATQKWQVVNRQQLYRDELAQTAPFEHHFTQKFSAIRIGKKMRVITID